MWSTCTLAPSATWAASKRSRSTGRSSTHTANIRKVSLQFRPGIGLRGQLSLDNLTFHKVKPLNAPAAEEEEGGLGA